VPVCGPELYLPASGRSANIGIVAHGCEPESCAQAARPHVAKACEHVSPAGDRAPPRSLPLRWKGKGAEF
jgi:hypothetical protein